MSILSILRCIALQGRDLGFQDQFMEGEGTGVELSLACLFILKLTSCYIIRL